MPAQPRHQKSTADASLLPAPDEVSRLLRDYARPLLEADPAGPADIETIKTSMMLAMICWNLPVYEAQGNALYAQGVRTLDAVMTRVPPAVAATLRRLIEDRKQLLAAHPFLVLVEVTGTTPENAAIVAEARMPAPER